MIRCKPEMGRTWSLPKTATEGAETGAEAGAEEEAAEEEDDEEGAETGAEGVGAGEDFPPEARKRSTSSFNTRPRTGRNNIRRIKRYVYILYKIYMDDERLCKQDIGTIKGYYM